MGALPETPVGIPTHRTPVVDLALLRNRSFGVITAATLVISVGLFAAITVLPALMRAPSGIAVVIAGSGDRREDLRELRQADAGQ